MIYTYARMGKSSVLPLAGLIETEDKEWEVNKTTLYGCCEYNRRLTEDEERMYGLVCISVREEGGE